MSDSMNSGIFPYEDIIGLERPVHKGDEFSFRHPKMEIEDRAKIFAPFAALRGFESSIENEAGAFRARRYHAGEVHGDGSTAADEAADSVTPWEEFPPEEI